VIKRLSWRTFSSPRTSPMRWSDGHERAGIRADPPEERHRAGGGQGGAEQGDSEGQVEVERAKVAGKVAEINAEAEKKRRLSSIAKAETEAQVLVRRAKSEAQRQRLLAAQDAERQRALGEIELERRPN